MRYIIGLLVTFGLIIMLIVLLVGGGGDKAEVSTTSKPLTSYSNTGAEVRLTIDGIVNSNAEHRQIRITVDRSNVTFEEIQGYNNTVLNMQRFDNNEDAFGVFLKSLELAGYTKGNKDEKAGDWRGYCPLGTHYLMELRQNENNLQRFWTNTCGQPKTYLGDRDLTVELFERQVPGYGDLISDIDI